MSAPRKHSTDDLLATAEETVRIMWRAYDAHLSLPRRDADWEEKAGEIYERCMACVDRVWQLKELRERDQKPQAQNSAGGATPPHVS